MIFKREFDCVVSIGDNCGCAILLNNARLRLASGPFDWVSGATFEYRIRTLCSRFADFLKIENLMPVAYGNSHREHDQYDDMVSGWHFIHDFPAGRSLHESYPMVNDKYRRRIRRLLDALDGGASVCFVWRCMEGQHLDVSTLDWTIDCLSKAFPRAYCCLLVMENDLSLPEVQFNMAAEGRVVLARGRFCMETDIKLAGNIPLQLSVLRQLPRSAALRRKCRRERMIRALVRLLSIWHPKREGRKKIRELLTKRFRKRDLAQPLGACGW